MTPSRPVTCWSLVRPHPGDLLFADELAAWRARFGLDVAITVDTPDQYWQGCAWKWSA